VVISEDSVRWAVSLRHVISYERSARCRWVIETIRRERTAIRFPAGVSQTISRSTVPVRNSSERV